MYPTDFESPRERPDPDALLAQMQAREQRAARGKLRIYFGASAGVGKTCAMLSAARKLVNEGKSVLVGVVETHGRADTQAMLDGLEVLPRKQVEYRGKSLAEFDIDAALERKPPLILIDELAHSNAPGSRHPKRWQDVEELLDAGIDVFTTLNVQHLESLNDVVGGITSIRVSETLPDRVFDNADEVVLVDVPADELLARLNAGKVYKATQAERAARNFFRKGNLIALRELALRRTADRVENDVQVYRIEQSISKVWKTDAALLACIGPRAGAEHIVRSCARLANQLNTDWFLVYVETPQLQRLPSSQRERILKTVKLAEELGATTAILTGSDIAQEIVHYARTKNLSKIVVGRGHRTWPWLTPHSKRISRFAPAMDLIEIGQGEGEQFGPLRETSQEKIVYGSRWHYLWASGASLLTAVVTTPLIHWLDLANIVMLFLLTVVLVAVRFGRGPAVVSAIISVIAFDFFFVPPRFSFAVSDVQYLITFAVMLIVGLVIGQLTAGLRFQARVSMHRESRSRALYEFARALSGVLATEQIFETTRSHLERTFRAKVLLLLPDNEGRLQPPTGQVSDALDIAIAQWSFDRATPAGIGTDTLPTSDFFYLPLIAPMRTRGVLVLQPEGRRWILIPEQRQQLDTFAALAAIALERVHYIEVAQKALVGIESERLRNSLLAALSHDLRTPLTSLVGLSESLTRAKPTLPAAQLSVARALHNEALRMSNLVVNLLDMARIQSGEVKLNLEWQPLEEVVGSALHASTAFLGQHSVKTTIAADLPLIQIDSVLIERVLCNLLENATKYTPPGAHIVIVAEVNGHMLDISVRDNGPGLPSGKEDSLFEKFTRGEKESTTPGVGLGLAICKAIVQAHGGKIRAGKAPEGGAAIVFSLPLGTPPALPDDINE
ncbi:two-component system sensor histidine kinase KdpD [Cellvibrio mixtus]|uniref:two-component system sensor histidine kinase KdpD n=1 Tax=Cellvibrio mixtus TaxID=39650 RepID=UPI000586966F|nr:two-component system sensor histidine kinase KdpD [Cellvibrio mixtus]